MADERKPGSIALFGCNGQIGHELSRCLKSLGSVTPLDKDDVDFCDPESLRDVVRRIAPDVVVNAAAYTAVDKAESEPQLAMTINTHAPEVLAEVAQDIGACLVHYSTDYVFDGTNPNAYEESATPNPQSVYGRSKFEGEQAVLSTCRKSLVLRTSWVFGSHGHNFLKTMLKLGAERESLSVVSDQIGAPTSARIVARTTQTLLSNMIHADSSDARWGLYHVAAAGRTSWHGFATHALEKAANLGYQLALSPSDIRPISTSEYPTAASRPANSVLSTRKIRTTFGLRFPDWMVEVDRVVGEIVN